MKKINIGPIILQKRKERDITQEELAQYMGVSKPAVSKWESGQSYPDILLLPLLAAYFNMSVDDLLGYEAQMAPQDARKLYRRLAEAFANQPFDEVYGECGEYIKTYYSCWYLLLLMAQLLINHAMLAGSPDRTNAIIREAAGLLERVERESGDAMLARQALALRAYCQLALQRPAEVIDLLDKEEEASFSAEVLLAKAYAMKGRTDKAKTLLQSSLYRNLAGIFAALPDLMTLYADDPDKTEMCLQRVLAVGSVFALEDMQPSLYFTMYLTAAALFAAQGRKERALDMLETYGNLIARRDLFPLKLHGDAFFDLLEPYLESLSLGAFAPRSDKVIWKDMRDIVVQHPSFQCLAAEPRYIKLVEKLRHLKEDVQ